MELAALALDRLGIPVESKPDEGLAQIRRSFRGTARGVQVLEAEGEARASAARVEPTKEPGEQGAGVSRTGGGGGEPAVRLGCRVDLALVS